MKKAKPLKSLASLKATEEMEKWVEGLQEKTGNRTKAGLIQQALLELAKKIGYDKPMPRR